ncbi:MAG: nucleotidyltransferase family protein [Alphaproteobacteria bacterium]
MSPIITCMLLAAGMGNRLKPLTDTTPKPLINVGGQPVILRALEAIKAAGITRVVINTHYLARMIETTVSANRMGLTIMFSREDDLLETGGGIKQALPLLGDAPFLVVNSDAVWDDSTHPLLRPLIQSFSTRKHDALLAVVPRTTTHVFRPEGGDFTLDKRTKKLTFAKDKSKAPFVYCGIHVTHPAFINFEPAGKFSLVRPWQSAAAQGRLHGYVYDGPWVDMGSHTGLECARTLASTFKLV